MPTHINTRYEEIETLLPAIQQLQELGEHYDITNIGQDGALITLQIIVATGLDVLPGRTGHDATDRMGNFYEIKSADITNEKVRGFCTSNRMTLDTIKRYRKCRWIFGTVDRVRLEEIYRVEPAQMEHLFQIWERKLLKAESLNNPKIPIDYVRKVGTVMYLKDVAPNWAVNEAA